MHSAGDRAAGHALPPVPAGYAEAENRRNCLRNHLSPSTGIFFGTPVHARARQGRKGVHSRVPPGKRRPDVSDRGHARSCVARSAWGGTETRCDPYHTGLWAVSQPDVSLQADTNFVQVWAGAAESAWSPGCNEARSGSKPRWTEGTAVEETPTARELVTGRCACSHHMGWKSSKAV